MSHFTRIKTQMVDPDLITRALADLGYEWERGDLSVRGFGLNRRQVEIKVKRSALSAEIGFMKSGGFYEIVADWSGVRGVSREAFRQQVLQRYAYHATRLKLEAQGFSLVQEETQKDGQIRLVLRRAG